MILDGHWFTKPKSGHAVICWSAMLGLKFDSRHQAQLFLAVRSPPQGVRSGRCSEKHGTGTEPIDRRRQASPPGWHRDLATSKFPRHLDKHTPPTKVRTYIHTRVWVTDFGVVTILPALANLPALGSPPTADLPSCKLRTAVWPSRRIAIAGGVIEKWPGHRLFPFPAYALLAHNSSRVGAFRGMAEDPCQQSR